MFKNYVGQRDSLTPLLVAIEAARTTGRALPHSLFLGRAGSGKTTLAHAVADEMQQPFAVLHGSSAIEQSAINDRIIEAANGVLYIDEIHALPRQLCENIYRLIDEGKIAVEYPVQKIKQKKLFINDFGHVPPEHRASWIGPAYYDVTYQVPTRDREVRIVDVGHVTVIGSTTDEALLPQPFYSRLSSLIVRLRAYTIDELIDIIRQHVTTFGMHISREAAEYLAIRARQTPRKAKQLAERAIDRAVRLDSGEVYMACAKAAIESLGIDPHGLEAPQRRILHVLGEHKNGLSRTTLSQVLGVPPRNLEMYWGPLQEDGLVMIDTRHRLTEKGRSYIG